MEKVHTRNDTQQFSSTDLKHKLWPARTVALVSSKEKLYRIIQIWGSKMKYNVDSQTG